MSPNLDSLSAQVEKIHQSGVLGQGRARQLFEYLVQCTRSGRAPKEAEIAVDVFGKQPTVDLAQDASVRVYVHNLRRRLDQFYSEAGQHEPDRLVLPKGEYRLTVVPNANAPANTEPPPAVHGRGDEEDGGDSGAMADGTLQTAGNDPAGDMAPAAVDVQPGSGVVAPPPAMAATAARGHAGGTASGPDSATGRYDPPATGRWLSGRLVAATALALLLGAGLGGAGVAWLRRPAPDAAAIARTSAFWTPVLHGKRPVLVLGDYYIFGDTSGDASMNVTRLIRDFAVNSKSDLQQYLLSRPEEADRYQDVGLSYLPTSSAYALSGLMPLLGPLRSQLRVSMASDLTPAMIKGSDLIYVGLLSGLGLLQGPVFANSRFRFGDSSDELIDQVTHHHYISQAVDYADAHFRQTSDGMYLDYAYFASLIGPAGNRITVIAGMQDEGLRQVADFLAEPANLARLARQVAGHPDFEGLLEVSGMDHANLSGRLLVAAPLPGVGVKVARQ